MTRRLPGPEVPKLFGDFQSIRVRRLTSSNNTCNFQNRYSRLTKVHGQVVKEVFV